MQQMKEDKRIERKQLEHAQSMEKIRYKTTQSLELNGGKEEIKKKAQEENINASSKRIHEVAEVHAKMMGTSQFPGVGGGNIAEVNN